MSVKRFERLRKIREAQENEVAVVLASRLAELNRAEQQRDQLSEYQSQYLHSGLPSDARMLKQMAQMQQQLREALQQQALRVAAAESQVEQARSVWMERHQATLSLAKLIERRRRTESVLDGRKQQREQDLWATRQAFQKHANADS
ncbi:MULTISPECIES: flagellar export protein FliJ [Thiocystis]|uniref:Flagellar FliJ protein n=1 Tax=Thiocystis violascens (strain ATCC 17096 / DSM 198 / 6111) TaxID=765911 RepID=I3Y613_THIV6|nr:MULTISPECIES: flagellar FliJ family protein [Thiocystis]AFL72431.1 Flagellar FliJ protein [Thiocystis violascens DSM 198]MBK5967131.1 flagellar export protein FliJ [Thiocystis minor]